jgi:hypothetical protein
MSGADEKMRARRKFVVEFSSDEIYSLSKLLGDNDHFAEEPRFYPDCNLCSVYGKLNAALAAAQGQPEKESGR